MSKNTKEIIHLLDQGKVRVAEKINGSWVTQVEIKEAIIDFFKTQKVKELKSGAFNYIDKIPVKKWKLKDAVRVVPQAIVRKGAFVNKGAILMPSYINIGAYVDEGTMVDTWATVGSCAQIGKNVHLSGGVGIGGVLEPAQAAPVIIEDNVFVGSRCIIVEGILVEEGAVLGAGVVLTASTKILDVTQKEVKIIKGRIPKNAVVIPGSIPKDFPAGNFQVPCALIIGSRSPSTDKKTSLNNALREFGVSV
jgi:2,3,4,5-tetrahydropyridine-2,6-dicarboxylate N-succinyltransferase